MKKEELEIIEERIRRETRKYRNAGEWMPDEDFVQNIIAKIIYLID